MCRVYLFTLRLEAGPVFQGKASVVKVAKYVRRSWHWCLLSVSAGPLFRGGQVQCQGLPLCVVRRLLNGRNPSVGLGTPVDRQRDLEANQARFYGCTRRRSARAGDDLPRAGVRSPANCA